MAAHGGPGDGRWGRYVKAQFFAVFTVGLLGMVCAMGSAVAADGVWYYAIEEMEGGSVLRRGTTGPDGIARDGLILAPDRKYREWLFDGKAGLVGLHEFTTPSAGQRFVLPPVRMGLPMSSDSDGDGLSDDAEFVLGTSPTKADTDGDGISDGAAVGLGIDPGLLSRTRVVGTADTEGTAVDVCVMNDIAIVADSAAGVTVFNVFNRMAPIRIAQVDTPGNALAVTCSGNLIGVADGSAGLSIIDISDPPAARIVRQIGIFELGGGSAKCIAALGDLAFVGTDRGWLTMVEMSTGIALEQIDLGGPVEDVAIAGEALYAFAAGQIQSVALLEGPMRVVGRAAVTGEIPAPRSRLFVGGGVAYVTFSNGYVAFSVSNPAAPRQLSEVRGPFFIWRHVVHDGSRYAVTPVGGTTPGLSRYLQTNAVSPAVFETTIEAPGALNAVTLYNGAAYLAAGERGLHVVNYREIDTGRQPPVGVLRTSVTNGVVTEGQRIVLRAEVRDDVQLRNVQFLVNGAPYLVDGNFPFEVGWRVPAGSAGSTVTLAATAIDTGGNETNLSPVKVGIVPDRVSPVVVIDGPVADAVFAVGDDIIVKAGLFDAIGVDFGAVEVRVDGEPVPSRRLGVGTWTIVSPSTLGTHTLGFRARDYAGNLGSAREVRFTMIHEAISSELTLAVLERAPGSEEAISRELTIAVLERAPETQEAISRELTTTVLKPAAQPSTRADRVTGSIQPSTDSEGPKP